MIKAKEITLTRAEGPRGSCGTAKVSGSNVWEQAQSILFRWSWTAPGGNGRIGGYDKCDFEITFEDGEIYKGRYDLTHPDVESPNLLKHVRDFLEFSSGQKCPKKWTDGTYQAVLRRSPETTKSSQNFLANYQIGD